MRYFITKVACELLPSMKLEIGDSPDRTRFVPNKYSNRFAKPSPSASSPGPLSAPPEGKYCGTSQRYHPHPIQVLAHWKPMMSGHSPTEKCQVDESRFHYRRPRVAIVPGFHKAPHPLTSTPPEADHPTVPQPFAKGGSLQQSHHVNSRATMILSAEPKHQLDTILGNDRQTPVN